MDGMEEPLEEEQRLLQEEAKHEEKRLRAKLEILTTERSYVTDLTTAVEVFMKPMQRKSLEEPFVISKEEISILFSNLEAILYFNQTLLGALEDEDANQISNIGQIFIDMSPYLRMYTIYVNGHTRATELHQQLTERNIRKDGTSPYTSLLAELGASHGDRLRNRLLTDLLIMPVQRVPRYRLLLEELLKRTKNDSEEFDTLEIGLAKIADVANLVNERLKEYENRVMVTKIEKRFGGNVHLVQPHRIFVMDGFLQKMCRKGPKEYYFCLFSDLLVYGVVGQLNLQATVGGDEEPTMTLKRQFELGSCSLSSLSDNSFQIASPNKSFVVIAPDLHVKANWYTAIEACMVQCAKNFADATLASTISSSTLGGSNEDKFAPVWTPDKDAMTCQLQDCNTKFTLMNRRHHCRSCGRVVCGPCSPHRWILPNIHKTKPQRLCDECYFEIRQNLEDDNYEKAGTTDCPRPAAPVKKIADSNNMQKNPSLFARLTHRLSGMLTEAPPKSTQLTNSIKPAQSPSSSFRERDNKVIVAKSSEQKQSSSPPKNEKPSFPVEHGTSSIPPSSPLVSVTPSTPSMNSSQEELPRNWRALKDESGKTYYWHVITDMVTYDRPTGKLLGRTGSRSSSAGPTRDSTSPNSRPKATTELSSKPIIPANKPSIATSIKSDPSKTTRSPPPINGSKKNATALSQTKNVGSQSSSTNSSSITQLRIPEVKKLISLAGAPSLPERLAKLADSGLLGDPNTTRFSVKPIKKPPPVRTSPISKDHGNVEQTFRFDKFSPKSASPKEITNKSFSERSSGSNSPIKSVSSSPDRVNGSLNGKTIPSITSSPTFRQTGSGLNKHSPDGVGQKKYAAALYSLNNPTKVELSKLSDSEFFKLMGMFRKDFDKLTFDEKINLKRQKNAA